MEGKEREGERKKGGERKGKKELYAIIWNGEVYFLFTAHGSNK